MHKIVWDPASGVDRRAVETSRKRKLNQNVDFFVDFLCIILMIVCTHATICICRQCTYIVNIYSHM